MKLLFVATSDDIQTGASLCYLAIAKEFLKRKVSFISIVPKEGDLEKELKNLGVKTFIVKDQPGTWQVPKGYQITLVNYIKYLIKCIYNFIAVKKTERIIKNEKIDIVHINSLSRCTGAVAAKNLNVPYIWHFRELVQDGLDSKFVNEEKAISLFKSAKRIICISNTVEKYYKERYKLKNTSVIYDGININDFYVEKDILGGQKIIISIIGRVDEQKRQNIFVEAIKKVAVKYKNLECYIVGGYYEDDYYHSLRKEINESHLENTVHFTGFVKDPSRYTKMSDIICICSHEEAFGLSTVEAMLSGTLVIASDSGSNKELVRNNDTGIIYRCDNTDDLMKKIVYSMSHREIANLIAKNGQKFAKKFSVEKNISKIFELYIEIINK